MALVTQGTPRRAASEQNGGPSVEELEKKLKEEKALNRNLSRDYQELQQVRTRFAHVSRVG